jgi:glycosyltransferase involved in cell wall biosynthesis
MSDHSLIPQFDPEFGLSISWDIDLLSDYNWEFIDTFRGGRLDSFGGLRLKRGFGNMLDQMGTNVLWVQGWQVAGYWQAIFEARHRGIEVWLRGDTNARSNVGGIARYPKRFLRRQLFRRIDRFLYVGEANRRFYLSEGVGHERLAPAPHCVDNKRFAAEADAARPARLSFRQKWGIPLDSFCFVFVGKFIAKKRPLDLMESARRLQQKTQSKTIHLLWIGSGELGDELRRVSHVCYDAERGHVDLGGGSSGPNASFLGFLNQTKVTEAYVAADCLVLPSDARETWGLVVNEAMATGLPCIVSDACGCVEDLIQPIRPDLTYRVADIGALERAMLAAMTRAPAPELLKRHVSKYDIDQTVNTVEDLYVRSMKRTVRRSDHVVAQ